MTTKILAFGIAKEIIGNITMPLELSEGTTVGELKGILSKQFPDFERLRSLSIAVNEEYQDDNFIIKQGDEVVIIPPVSGG